MSEIEAEIEERASALLSRVDVVERPQEAIARIRSELGRMDEFWAVRESDYRARPDGAAAAQEAAQIREVMRVFIGPALERLSKMPLEEQGRLINLMVPFDSEGGIRDFLLHFFQIALDRAGKLVYQERDSYERELYILHDLYKVKRTLEVIGIIRQAEADPANRFPSIFSPERQTEILDRLQRVLELMFTQALPSRHRQRIMSDISPRYLSAAELLRRREAQLLYTYPHVLERYEYRRFFFLMYFKEGLKAKFEQEVREYRYNFLHFQSLKREYLVHWLESRLKGNPHKFKAYSKYRVRGKSLLNWINEEPDREAELLLEMASPEFNEMVGEINEQLPKAEQVAIDPDTEKFGLYHELRKQLREATARVKAPIETLRKDVEEGGPLPEPESPEPEPEPEPPPEPKWEITLLKKTRVAHPFLQTPSAGYPTQLTALKQQLGAEHREFAQYVSKLLDSTPEMNTIRRRTPKHEWVMPYHLRRTLPEETLDYLLILGAEVRAKQRGMSYQAREQYNFTPYMIFGAAQPEEGFGEAIGKRPAAGIEFDEYPLTPSAVRQKALELLDKIKEQNPR